ncbi:MAG: MarR family transcriptional regulator [Alphaproteobacteria bacterium]|jgi:DNA-binding MarR family transcriptional regulator|nr:MarR family transcriptional regulator [Alphaproteobacteria bacterium]MDP6566735.1 MarR family transcriptional regulator [Alphaproteobacteria bacterium]MDP6814711.1 MarR family transcriptional regulator [Alphaproteobacteria bacterium]
MADAATPTTPPAGDFETGLEGNDKLQLRLWLRLLTCSNLIESEIRRRLRRDFATTLPRFDLLSQLDRSPGGLSMTELSQRLMVSNGNLTGLVDRLVADGQVSRRADPKDRRTSHISLTARGKRHFDEMTPAHETWVEDMLAGLGGSDMRQLHALLAQLKQSVGGSKEA